MKRLSLLFVFVMAIFSVFAQKSWVPFTSQQPEQAAITILNSDRAGLTLEVKVPGMFTEMISQENLTFQRLTLIEEHTTQQVGLPELPMLHQVIGIPGNQKVSFKIVEMETMKLTGYTVYPFQTPTTDNPGGHNHPFVMDMQFYGKNVDYPEYNAFMDQPGIWRDVKVTGLHVTPFTYNPVTKEITVITHMKLEVEFSGVDNIVFNPRMKLTPKFYNMYQTAIPNFDDLGYTETLREEVGIKYLVITNAEALPAIQPLVEWKNKMGHRVEVRLKEAGFNTPQNFKDYIAQLYESDGLEYVLMVGDAYPNGGTGTGPNLIPMYWWAPSGEDPSYSDSWYSCLDGADDHFADLAIGRFTYDVNALSELEMQISKTMTHYLTPDVSDNWAENTILIAHQEEYPGKYTLCCEQIRTYPYSVQVPIFETAYGGAGATNQDVINFVNSSACGIFNYRGHGSTTELWQWGASGSFTATHVNQLTNANRLFVFFDVCCDNMDIVAYNGECLCESFMKHPNASVAVNGAIIPSYTIPNHDYDKEMYKAVYDENITNIGYVTNFANVTVLNVHGTLGRSNVRTYLWLGDASIESWTKQPSNLTVTHDDQIFLGISEFPVTVINTTGSAENAMVCVSNEDGTIYGVAYTDATGIATIVFDGPIQTPGEANVTVTLNNYLPYQAIVPVIPQEGPYVVKDSYTINDAAGNNNGMLDYGEAILLSLSVKNVGIVTAENVTVTISTEDTYVTITDDTEVYGNIDPNQVVTIADGFALEAAENIPDGHAVLIAVSANDGTDTWNSNIVIMGHAPALAFDHFVIDDSNGNNNGFLDPGETATMTVTVANNGSSDAYNVMGLLSGTDPYVTVGTLEPQAYGDLSATTMSEANFTVSAAANTPFGYTAQLTLDLTADMGIVQQDILEILFSDYCDASTSVEDEYISNVAFGEISNSSGWQGLVADYTDITTTLQPGVGVPITITNGNAWAADIVYVWIDWNLNKEFGNTNETFQLTNVGGSGQTFTGTITAPAGQAPGPYRMRIRMTYSTAPVPCGDATYGEIEDYTVIIAGINVNFSANVTSGCPGLEIQFTDNSTGGGTQWEWQFPGGTPETSTEQNPVVLYSTSGVFDVTLTVTGPLGTNTMTKTAYISISPMPAVPGEVTGNTQGCQGYTELYTVGTIANATSYVWSLEPAEAGTVVSQNLNEMSILWSDAYEGAAIIKVCGVNQCGEGGWSADFNVAVENCVGIGENDNNSSLSIYPNPSNGKFTIELNLNDVVSINLLNALGETVYQITSVEVKGNFTKTIETRNLSEGVYYLKIEGVTTTINKKVVISK